MEVFDNKITTHPIVVILPVYNGIKYLELAVQSVLQQQFSLFEFLIIDDCSTDGSWEYLQSVKDSRVTLYRNTNNKGLFYNLNFLIEKSTSSLIKLWSQDDIMHLDCIQEVVLFHELHPFIGFSYTDREYIDASGIKIPNNRIDNTPSIISKDLHTRIACITGSIAGNIANVTIAKAALDKVGLFNEEMKISGDFDMWVRIAREFTIGFIKKPLIQLRNHKGQLSNRENLLIYHVMEDISVYRYLFSYLDKAQKAEGMKLLRNQKLLFYYTLMLKAFFRGRFITGSKFFNSLFKFDNFFILTWFYAKKHILKISEVTKPGAAL